MKILFQIVSVLTFISIVANAASAVPEIPRELSKSEYSYFTNYVVRGDWPSCRTALSGSVEAKGNTELATPWASCADDLLRRKAEKRAIAIAVVGLQTYCYTRFFRGIDSQTKHLAACRRYY
jgi:hypothetical protein